MLIITDLLVYIIMSFYEIVRRPYTLHELLFHRGPLWLTILAYLLT